MAFRYNIFKSIKSIFVINHRKNSRECDTYETALSNIIIEIFNNVVNRQYNILSVSF